MDSKLRKMAILASMAVILLVALLVMYVNREQFTAASGPHPALRMPERVTVHLRRKMAIRQKRRSHRMVRSAMI